MLKFSALTPARIQTSRGNAIIAELLRLADNVPEPFLLARRQDQVLIRRHPMPPYRLNVDGCCTGTLQSLDS